MFSARLAGKHQAREYTKHRSTKDDVQHTRHIQEKQTCGSSGLLQSRVFYATFVQFNVRIHCHSMVYRASWCCLVLFSARGCLCGEALCWGFRRHSYPRSWASPPRVRPPDLPDPPAAHLPPARPKFLPDAARYKIEAKRSFQSIWKPKWPDTNKTQNAKTDETSFMEAYLQVEISNRETSNNCIAVKH